MRSTCERMAAEIRKVVVGQDEVVELALAAAMVGGHLLIEGVPGVAKTTLATALARSMAVKFRRLQFTPDMAPSDVTGRIGPSALGHTFHPGPVFTNVLLGDEINRTPPHTQAALLEAMQEHQVTVAGEIHHLPDPFLVLATQNPIDHEGTYPLPESQLDRFLFKAAMDYPSEREERAILDLPHRGVTPSSVLDVSAVVTGADLLEARAVVDSTKVTDEIVDLITHIVRRTRVAPGVVLGASPRAAVHLLAASKAAAQMDDRTYVETEDVRRMALPTLRHRLILHPHEIARGRNPDEVVTEVVSLVMAR